MRRWVLIILLLVYPFQVALAVADKCCVSTPAGVTHHSADGASPVAESVFIVDDSPSSLGDPHCPACSFGHSFYLPSDPVVLSAARHHTQGIAFTSLLLTSPPAVRLERPKWMAAAR